MNELTHLDSSGAATMVDVGEKPETRREAVAFAAVRARPETMDLLRNGAIPKGDVWAAARIAGILAAKRVDELIPLCHGLALQSVTVHFRMSADRVIIRAVATTVGRTGVEMEALTAASLAALTLYDMCKAVDRDMIIGPVFLASKTGGRSGTHLRDVSPDGWDEGTGPWL